MEHLTPGIVSAVTSTKYADPMDPATRRQLRFSLFLQGFAALMISLALGVRLANQMFDIWSIVFAVVLVLVVAAFLFTQRKLRSP